MPVGEKHKLRFGPFQLDTQFGQVSKDGIVLKLQGQPVQILEMLVENPGELITREQLRQRLWASDTFVDFDHSLNTAIKKLRQALSDEADTPRYIQTLPKRGYRFLAEVSEDKEAREPSPERQVVDNPAENIRAVLADSHFSTAQKSSVLRRWRITVMSATILLILAIVGYWVTRSPVMPRIVGSRVLVKTGFSKIFLQRLLTDGVSVYFQEVRPPSGVTLRVPINGGEVSELPSLGGIGDISRDGTKLVFDVRRPDDIFDALAYPLPNGPPRMMLKDAGWAFWSADGHSIFFTRKNETELFQAREDGTELRFIGRFPNIFDPRLSPDGKRIRFREYPALKLWEVGVDGKNAHTIFPDYKDFATGSWSPDGEFYFFRGWDGERFSLWVVAEQHHWWRIKHPIPQHLLAGPMSLGQPLVSRDGKHIFATGIEHRAELVGFDAKSGQFIPYLSGIPACYLDFSRDRQWITYVSYPEGTLWRMKADGTQQMQLTEPPIAVVSPRWSPDGKLILFTDLANGDRRKLGEHSRIYAVSADGGAPMLLVGDDAGTEGAASASWSPDGSSIVYASKARILRILNLRTQTTIDVPDSVGKSSPRWSPNGRYLIAIARDPYLSTRLQLVLFDTKAGAWQELTSPGVIEWWPSWSDDSRFVYYFDLSVPTRVDIQNRTKTRLAPRLPFRSTAFFIDRYGFGWTGFTPDGLPLITRDTGSEQIYAFDLEFE